MLKDVKAVAKIHMRSRTDLTRDAIEECVRSAFLSFPDLDVAEHGPTLVRELESEFQTVIGQAQDLVGKDEGWTYWLPERRARLKWKYWDRYKSWLEGGSMGQDVTKALDESTDRVLGLLGDPERAGAWDRRGLVVGQVQSGKTSHYIGLINRAVDAHYKLIVVLTGFTNSLRTQTQIRLEEGFLGYCRSRDPQSQQLTEKQVGVGTISPLRPETVTIRSSDFRTNIANHYSTRVGTIPILFAIKKNSTVLRNLIGWVETTGTHTREDGRKFYKTVPLLVIDDESDVGSVDTRKGGIVDDVPDEEHAPAKINEQIRKLLSLFEKSSYVGYTATPFANVLIHDGGHTAELGDDLFPRSFIHALPAPSNYIGPSMVFGDADADNQLLPVVRIIPAAEAEGASAWIPLKQSTTTRPEFDGREEIPPSLRQAILAFILVCSARRLRQTELSEKHNSMLIHVTRLNAVQDLAAEQVRDTLTGIQNQLQNWTGHKDLLEELRQLWCDGANSFTGTTRRVASRDGVLFRNPEHSWDDIQNRLREAALPIEVRVINGSAGDVLEYESHPEGLNVIAIGGDKLSRGLTLEGLSVSYFLRNSRMYDTLMQMGRWFGYRPGYVDLCRLYLPEKLEGWFTHITSAAEELNSEFVTMQKRGATPMEFGLRIRSHSKLMVTSRVKMRHGEARQVTFQGDIVQTINFRRDVKTVTTNWSAAEALMQEGRSFGEGVGRTKVGGENVRRFLEAYVGHDAALTARPNLLHDYVKAEVARSRLTEWTVYVAQGRPTAATRSLAGKEVHLVDRGWFVGRDQDKWTEEIREGGKQSLIDEDHFRIRILVDPPDEAFDLTEPQKAEALAETIEDWKIHPGNRRTAPTTGSGKAFRSLRAETQGLLILYPLDSGDRKAETDETPILGFAVSFPTVRSAPTTVRYIVSNIYQQMEMDFQ